MVLCMFSYNAQKENLLGGIMKLPPRGVKVEDLKCKKCGKTQKECKPKDCTDPDCPYKKEQQE